MRRIFQSVFYGKTDFNVSIEVAAEKLAENLKKTLSEKKLLIYLYLQPNLEHECQINLSYHPSQGNLIYVPFQQRNREDFHSSLINQVGLIVII